MRDHGLNDERSAGALASPTAMMRLSSLLFLFLTLGHMSAYPWRSAGSPREVGMIDAMKSIDFVFMGERSTYWGLYFGWGLLVAILLLTIAALLWLLADLARLAPRRVGMMAGILAATCAIGTYLSFRFFYVPPLLSFAANGLILLIVAVRLLNAPPERTGLRFHDARIKEQPCAK